MKGDALVLFGITGDLAHKKLYGALAGLEAADALGVPVIGVASSDWDDDKLRAEVRSVLGASVDAAVVDRLCGRLRYVKGDYSDPATYRALHDALGGAEHPVCYLAIPPSLFDDVAEGLAGIDVQRGGRIVLEKPFGRDLASAQELNALLHKHFTEDAIYRIDHFLGKEPVQNLMVVPLRQHAARAGLEPPLRAERPGDDGRILRRRGTRLVLRRRRRACGTSCRTTCCRWSACSPWSRRSPRSPTRCATRP